jgi:hypothetical protein
MSGETLLYYGDVKRVIVIEAGEVKYIFFVFKCAASLSLASPLGHSVHLISRCFLLVSSGIRIDDLYQRITVTAVR